MSEPGRPAEVEEDELVGDVLTTSPAKLQCPKCLKFVSAQSLHNYHVPSHIRKDEFAPFLSLYLVTHKRVVISSRLTFYAIIFPFCSTAPFRRCFLLFLLFCLGCLSLIL